MLNRIYHKEYTAPKKEQIRNELNVLQIIDEIMPLIQHKLNHFSVHPNDKEDLCQEVLIKLYRALSKFDFTKSTPLEHYVNRVIKNIKNDYIRKKMNDNRRQEMLVNEFLVTYNSLKSETYIERYIISKEVTAQLKQCLNRLTPLEQKIINYILNDYKPKEIANLLDLNIKVVYNAIQRCKIKIRCCLKK